MTAMRPVTTPEVIRRRANVIRDTYFSFLAFDAFDQFFCVVSNLVPTNGVLFRETADGDVFEKRRFLNFCIFIYFSLRKGLLVHEPHISPIGLFLESVKHP